RTSSLMLEGSSIVATSAAIWGKGDTAVATVLTSMPSEYPNSVNRLRICLIASSRLVVGAAAGVAPLVLRNDETSLSQSIAAATAWRRCISSKGGAAQLNAKVSRELEGLVSTLTKPRSTRCALNFAGTDSITSNSPASI